MSNLKKTANAKCATLQAPKKSIVVNLTNVEFSEDQIDGRCEVLFKNSDGTKRHVSECRCVFSSTLLGQDTSGINSLLLNNEAKHLKNCNCSAVVKKRWILREMAAANRLRTDTLSKNVIYTLETQMVCLVNPDSLINFIWDTRDSTSTTNLVTILWGIVEEKLRKHEGISVIILPDDDPYSTADYLMETYLFCKSARYLQLKSSITFHNYENVSLSHWDITNLIIRNYDENSEELGQFTNFCTLTFLELVRNVAVDDHFLNSIQQNCPMLTHLYVVHCPNISDVSVNRLIRARNLTLETICLNMKCFSIDLSESIILCAYLKQLSLTFPTYSSLTQFAYLHKLPVLEDLRIVEYVSSNNYYGKFYFLASEATLPCLKSLYLKWHCAIFPAYIFTHLLMNAPCLESLTVYSLWEDDFQVLPFYMEPISIPTIVQVDYHFKWKRVLHRVRMVEENGDCGVRTLSDGVPHFDWSFTCTHSEDQVVRDSCDWLHITVIKGREHICQEEMLETFSSFLN